MSLLRKLVGKKYVVDGRIEEITVTVSRKNKMVVLRLSGGDHDVTMFLPAKSAAEVADAILSCVTDEA